MEMGIIIASAILSAIAVVLSMVSIIMLIAREKATHTVQMVPVDAEVDRANELFLQEQALSKYNTEYKEAQEEQFPEFAIEDEEEEKFSI